jgi:hypothetical protein
VEIFSFRKNPRSFGKIKRVSLCELLTKIHTISPALIHSLSRSLACESEFFRSAVFQILGLQLAHPFKDRVWERARHPVIGSVFD